MNVEFKNKPIAPDATSAIVRQAYEYELKNQKFNSRLIFAVKGLGATCKDASSHLVDSIRHLAFSIFYDICRMGARHNICKASCIKKAKILHTYTYRSSAIHLAKSFGFALNIPFTILLGGSSPTKQMQLLDKLGLCKEYSAIQKELRIHKRSQKLSEGLTKKTGVAVAKREFAPSKSKGQVKKETIQASNGKKTATSSPMREAKRKKSAKPSVTPAASQFFPICGVNASFNPWMRVQSELSAFTRQLKSVIQGMDSRMGKALNAIHHPKSISLFPRPSNKRVSLPVSHQLVGQTTSPQSTQRLAKTDCQLAVSALEVLRKGFENLDLKLAPGMQQQIMHHLNAAIQSAPSTPSEEQAKKYFADIKKGIKNLKNVLPRQQFNRLVAFVKEGMRLQSTIDREKAPLALVHQKDTSLLFAVERISMCALKPAISPLSERSAPSPQLTRHIGSLASQIFWMPSFSPQNRQDTPSPQFMLSVAHAASLPKSSALNALQPVRSSVREKTPLIFGVVEQASTKAPQHALADLVLISTPRGQLMSSIAHTDSQPKSSALHALQPVRSSVLQQAQAAQSDCESGVFALEILKEGFLSLNLQLDKGIQQKILNRIDTVIAAAPASPSEVQAQRYLSSIKENIQALQKAMPKLQFNRLATFVEQRMAAQPTIGREKTPLILDVVEQIPNSSLKTDLPPQTAPLLPSPSVVPQTSPSQLPAGMGALASNKAKRNFMAACFPTPGTPFVYEE